MLQPINVTYEAVTSVYRANQILRELETYPIIAWDLEVATKYTAEDIDEMVQEIEKIEKRLLENNYN